MVSEAWDIAGISAALGAEVVTSKPDVLCLRLAHQTVGTRLKLEMAPTVQAIRLRCDQVSQGKSTLISRCDLFRVSEVVVDEARSEVRFRTTDQNPTELMITEDATFHLTVGVMVDELTNGRGERNGAATTQPTAMEDSPQADGLIHLVGKLARPFFSNRTGKPFFTAGLAEHPDQAIAPVWHNLKAFGGVALQAQYLQRGQWVRLSGKVQEDRYHKAGDVMPKPVILLVHIEAAD